MNPEITICIVHYNKIDKLRNTVSALEERTNEPYRLKILNNGYEDEEILSYLAELEQQEMTEVIYSDENLGCPPGRHRILQDIETEYAMTLDDDMYVEEGWLEEILEVFEKNPEIGVVGVPYREGDKLRGGAEVVCGEKTIEVNRIDWSSIPNEQDIVTVDDVPGGTMVFRTELLEEFNWDPQFFVGMGDLDTSLQIMATDWRQVMVATTSFEHDVVTDEEYTQVRKDYQERHRSYRKFVSKWGYRYSFRRHMIFNYFFRLPWRIMSIIESVYNILNP